MKFGVEYSNFLEVASNLLLYADNKQYSKIELEWTLLSNQTKFYKTRMYKQDIFELYSYTKSIQLEETCILHIPFRIPFSDFEKLNSTKAAGEKKNVPKV